MFTLSKKKQKTSTFWNFLNFSSSERDATKRRGKARCRDGLCHVEKGDTNRITTRAEDEEDHATTFFRRKSDEDAFDEDTDEEERGR